MTGLSASRYWVAILIGFASVVFPSRAAVQPVQIMEGPTTFHLTGIESRGSSIVSADFNNDGLCEILIPNGLMILVSSNGSYLPPATLLTNASDHPVLTGDFNGDGKLDILAGSSLLAGNGDATFVQQLNPLGGVLPMAAGDIDGDGRIDLFGNDGRAYFQQQDGNYLAVDIAPGSGLWGHLMGDFDGDEKAEPAGSIGTNFIIFDWVSDTFVATTNSLSASHVFDMNRDGEDDLVLYGNDIRVHLSNGDGSFETVLTSPVNWYTSGLDVGDFNRDGLLDIVTFRDDPGARALRFGTSSNTWSEPVEIGQYQWGKVLAASGADLDGDGFADLAIFFDNSPIIPSQHLSLDVALSTRDELTRIRTLPLFFSLQGDFNKDGRTDLFAFMYGDVRDTTLLANSSTNFDEINHDIPDVTRGIDGRYGPIGDFNADGNLDVATATTNGLQTLLGNGDGTFALGPTYPVSTNQFGAETPGDFNSDGKTDLFLFANGQLELIFGRGDGGFGPQKTVITTNASFEKRVVAGNLNGDAHNDFVVLTPDGKGVQVYLGDGHGAFQPGWKHMFGTNFVWDISVADFNRDGRDDIVIMCLRFLAVHFQTATGSFTPVRIYENSAAVLVYLEQGDFNADGFPDILCIDHSAPIDNYSRFFLGTGTTAFQSQTINRGLFPSGDNTGDSAVDFLSSIAVHPNTTPFARRIDLTWQDGAGALHTWFLRGTNFYQAEAVRGGFRVPSGWRPVGFNDFNADGERDLLLQNSDGRIAAWLFKGTNVIGAKTLRSGPAASTGWRLIGTAHFNDDQQPDFLWQNAQGQLAVWLMDGTNLLTSKILRDGKSPGSGWRIVTAADFNKDTKPDLLWQHDSGVMAVWLMDGTNFTSSITLRNGTPVAAGWKAIGAHDFNEDNSSDIFFRHTDGRVLLWLMNGTNVVRGLNVRNNLPAPADWTLIGAR